MMPVDLTIAADTLKELISVRDIVVITTVQEMSGEEVLNIKRVLKALLPNKEILFDSGIKLTVLHKT